MHLKAGRPEDALEDAKQATVQCPEYLKGHYRVGQALRALGHTAEADVVEGQIRTYRALVQLLPWYGLALLMLGWTSQATSHLVYHNKRRQMVVADLLKRGRHGGKAGRLVVTAELVPFMTAQYLLLGAECTGPGPDRITADALDFIPLDEDNGVALTASDDPDTGVSGLAAERAPAIISAFVGELLASGLPVTEVALRMGLRGVSAKLQSLGLPVRSDDAVADGAPALRRIHAHMFSHFGPGHPWSIAWTRRLMDGSEAPRDAEGGVVPGPSLVSFAEDLVAGRQGDGPSGGFGATTA